MSSLQPPDRQVIEITDRMRVVFALREVQLMAIQRMFNEIKGSTLKFRGEAENALNPLSENPLNKSVPVVSYPNNPALANNRKERFSMTENYNKPYNTRRLVSMAHHTPMGLGALAAAEAARGIKTPSKDTGPIHQIMPVIQRVSPYPLVVNQRNLEQNQHPAVYIGRGSPWGNPYVIGRDGSRDEVCEKYERDFVKACTATTRTGRRTPEAQALLVSAITLLRGQNLRCFCHPKRCHGHFLRDLVNADDPELFLINKANKLP